MTGRSLEREVADLTHAIEDPDVGLNGKVDRASSRSKALITWVKVLCAVVAVSVAVGAFAVYAFVRQHDNDAKRTHDLRAADCMSLADIGNMVKQGVTAVDAPPDQQTARDKFIAKYDAVIDAAVIAVRANKGYSADCSVIGNPPSPRR